jgi:tRNA nucleotidyltransferase (CCA-adding enzyme)
VEGLFGVPQSPEHHPEIDTGLHVMQTIDFAASAGLPLEARYALLAHDLGKGTTPREEWPRHIGHEERSVELARGLSERLRATNECRDLALLGARWHGDIHRAAELRPATLLKILEGADAFRRPERFALLLEVCRADRQSRPGFGERPYVQADRCRKALAAAQAVDAGAVAQASPDPQRIGERVHQARAEAIRAALGGE